MYRDKEKEQKRAVEDGVQSRPAGGIHLCCVKEVHPGLIGNGHQVLSHLRGQRERETETENIRDRQRDRD